MSDKQLVLNAVQEFPDSITLEEISRHVNSLAARLNGASEEEIQISSHTMAAIERGEADIAAGRVHTHAEVKEMIAQWRAR